VSSGPRWLDADAYIFDIDGTLLNASGRAHYNAFSSALESIFGLRTTIDGVRWAGNTDIGILREVLEREGLSGDELDFKLNEVIEHMCVEVESNREHVRADVCPSINEIVRELNCNGRLLGVASGNFSRIGWIKVEAAGLRPYFSFGYFSDQFATRTEIFRAAIEEVRSRLGSSATTCIVGDTPSDIQAAKANYVPIIAVATGTYSYEELRSFSPDVCLRCCDDALPLDLGPNPAKISA
jgi:phosphoglycolate phosphatase-like HAD superfamily hydrolase